MSVSCLGLLYRLVTNRSLISLTSYRFILVLMPADTAKAYMTIRLLRPSQVNLR